MSEPFSSHAREIHFSRACAKYHRQLPKLMGRINQDIASRGFAAQTFHPKLMEAFRLVNTV